MRKMCIVLLACGSLLLFSCNPKSSPQPSQATLEVVYACYPPLYASSSQFSILNLKVNGEFSEGVGGGNKPAEIMDRPLQAGNSDITFDIESGTTDTSYAEFKLKADPGKRYLVLFSGPANNASKILLDDSLPAADPNSALIRFIDLSSDNTTFNCLFDTIQLNSGLGYQKITPFFSVPAGTSAADTVNTISFANPSNPSIKVSQNKLFFQPGGIYSVILLGSNSGTALGLTIYKYLHNPVITL